MDESMLTGETDLMAKEPLSPNDPDNKKANCFLYSGSKVMEGVGKVVVCAIGVNSVNGKLKLSLQEESDPTPL